MTNTTVSTSERADRIAWLVAALRKDANSHGVLSAHLVTDAIILECATVSVDAWIAYDNAKVI